ncbi:hypothetical protein LN042_16415 [Kitasatospora sp. RB6PN24]|uniref:hypothetical protein n=1 Tax=Kitasatospora humi TaxID=2893891 RepID=UPI001E3D18AE|nr:hypothetical protein [Kitasatospora humi]MCC9308646.1 hypothetical protein [Kitasatospora humi]
MITIRSLLRGRDGRLIELDGIDDPRHDPDYMEGAIELSIDGVAILSGNDWDYIDELWAYIGGMLEKLDNGEPSAATYFPDQPLLLEMRRVSEGRLAVSCKHGKSVRAATVSEQELLGALRDSGREFFEAMARAFPVNAESYSVASRAFYAG